MASLSVNLASAVFSTVKLILTITIILYFLLTTLSLINLVNRLFLHWMFPSLFPLCRLLMNNLRLRSDFLIELEFAWFASDPFVYFSLPAKSIIVNFEHYLFILKLRILKLWFSYFIKLNIKWDLDDLELNIVLETLLCSSAWFT